MSIAAAAPARPSTLTLNDHARRIVAEILKGDRPHTDLKAAFDWEATPEGHAYWSSVRRHRDLPASARAKLSRALSAPAAPGAGRSLVA
ncbi:MAG: hypothetical protein K2Y29_00500 [Beijerinckiaceae bacterium]|nr:hypothetical protein [Beijerinckiaceae bacterium]